jgi:hypothetical protein
MKTPKKKTNPPGAAMVPAFQLRLYVAGQTAKSVDAFVNLKRICETHLAGQYRIELIDLLETPPACGRRPNPRGSHAGAPPA